MYFSVPILTGRGSYSPGCAGVLAPALHTRQSSNPSRAPQSGFAVLGRCFNIHSGHPQFLTLRIYILRLPPLIRPLESAGTTVKISLIAAAHFSLESEGLSASAAGC